MPLWIQNNVGVILTAIVLLVTGTAAYTRLEGQVSNLDRYRAERAVTVDTALRTIEGQVARLPQLEYRITANEEAMKATNARVDTSLSNISSRLAEINQALGSLSTQVAVLTQRLEAVAPERRSALQINP